MESNISLLSAACAYHYQTPEGDEENRLIKYILRIPVATNENWSPVKRKRVKGRKECELSNRQ